MGKHRPRLLLRFGLISALAIAALGVVLVAELNSTIRGQAVDEGRTLARLATDLRVLPNLHRSDLSDPNPLKTARLAGVIDADDLKAAGVERINVWNRAGQIVFSSATERSPKQEAVTADLRE